ncbi:uncharacterized protein LOC133903533 [Phragmites australis]|uniref:uncharacterized protein LOC133903533 n=1 Tax=Phragmites australis TaxID=29695 RepID=UPI002D796E3B|nr:uncharacterized protein LOC133903533 [Phragmites australis]
MGKQLPLCMVFLMAFLIVFAMPSVPAEAGRALGQASIGTGTGPTMPGRTPSVPRGQPDDGSRSVSGHGSGRICASVPGCSNPPPGAP